MIGMKYMNLSKKRRFVFRGRGVWIVEHLIAILE
jgi:hypothetical protein